MDERVQRYLHEFERRLMPLPASEREDAVREIASHFEEGLRSGTSPMVLLARLGEPAALARAYLIDHHAATAAIGIRELRRTLAVSFAVVGSSLTGALLVPTLLGIAIVFGLLALLSPVAGLARTFGATWIVMKFGGQDLPAIWSLPVALVAGALCASVAYLTYRMFRIYLRLVLAAHRAARSDPMPV